MLKQLKSTYVMPDLHHSPRKCLGDESNFDVEIYWTTKTYVNVNAARETRISHTDLLLLPTPGALVAQTRCLPVLHESRLDVNVSALQYLLIFHPCV